MTTRADILQRLQELEGDLLQKEREAEATRTRIQRQRAALAELETPQAADGEVQAPQTPKEKVALFRSLFRGREDVFPRLWISRKTNRKGYSPVCANENDRLLCDKFQGKCGTCPNRVYVPLNDQVIVDHLKGSHVIGVYPMLPDETCRFLAADFDGEGWQEDALAFIVTCRQHSVPGTLERSRSGEGAHVWVFFSAPVSAASARKLGCFLLTETMNRRHQLSMKSYDRLFPNQDTMPQGGFGNLIALPLQQGPRREGNTLFLDENLRPFPDQWAHLASLAAKASAILSRTMAT